MLALSFLKSVEMLVTRTGKRGRRGERFPDVWGPEMRHAAPAHAAGPPRKLCSGFLQHSGEPNNDTTFLPQEREQFFLNTLGNSIVKLLLHVCSSLFPPRSKRNDSLGSRKYYTFMSHEDEIILIWSRYV